MAKLKWEWVVNESSQGVPSLIRTQVENGWLVAAISENVTTSVTFMPDAAHKWEVDIDSGLTVTFPSNHTFDVGNNAVGTASIPEPNLKDLIKVIVNLSNRLTDKRDIN